MAHGTFTFRVDEELKAAFSEVAATQERSAAQLIRLLMRDTVHGSRESLDHDSWFRGEIVRAIDEADDPSVKRVPHEQVRSSWRQQRAELERRGAGRTA